MKKAIGGLARRVLQSSPAVLALVIAVGVGVAYSASNGNGSDSNDNGGPPLQVHRFIGPKLSDSDQTQLQAFQKCMQGQGLTRPKPGTAPSSDDLAKLRAAEDACISQFPTDLPYQFMGPPGPPGGPMTIHHGGPPPPGAPPMAFGTGGPPGGQQGSSQSGN